MRALLVTAAVAAALAAGCGGAAQPPAQPPARQSPAGPSPGRPNATASAPVRLTSFQACRLLRDDLARNQGVPDIPTLRHIADHVTAPRIAADARTAVRDIGHTGAAPVALALLRDDCGRAGVRIPAR